MSRRLIFLFLLLGVACTEPREVAVTPAATPNIATREIVTATPITTPGETSAVLEATTAVDVTTTAAPPTPTLGPQPTLVGDACGRLLPVQLADLPETNFNWRRPPLTTELIPSDALPAIEHLFENPGDVSLVVYRTGYEGIGFYHNANQPMPLASLSKLVELVAYGEAVDNGFLSPTDPVSLAELNNYYLPRSDLGSHNEALRELDGDNLVLDDLIWMMLRHSANSASDYLHERLGQATVEQTVVDLDLGPHSAPCTFLGRFLAMAQPAGMGHSLSSYLSQPTLYGEDVVRLAELYVNDEQFREQAQAAWARRGQPSIETQTDFVANFETRGTASGYAALMAGLATGRIGTPETNALMRQHLEWPGDAFPINQERYQFVGYKNGTLPGVLTTAYYSWPYWSDQPVVVVLLIKNLPTSTYQTWRRQLPHDALAHWLMSDPNAIHIMHVWRDSAAGN